MELKNKADTFLVSFDYTHGDIPVLIVGRRGTEKEIDIINAFQGDEARELYQKLTIKRKENHETTEKINAGTEGMLNSTLS